MKLKQLLILLFFPLMAHSQAYIGTKKYDKINDAAQAATTGDVVKIKPGVYRETIIPKASGVTFIGEPGTIISGLNPLSTAWTVHSGNIYKTSVTLPVNGYNASSSNNTTLLANQIFKDKVMMFEARWPDLNVPEDLIDRSKVRKITNAGNTTITDSGIPANVVGATYWINGWYLSRTGKVTGQSGSTITLNPGAGREQERHFYYLTGKLSLLSTAKEWHYENGTLYFWQPGGGVPTGVEYKARNYGFDVRDRANITIKGLEFIGCDPVVGNAASAGIVVDGIKAKYINHGVIVQPTSLPGVSASMATSYWNAKQVGIKLIGIHNVIKNSEIEFGIHGIWLGEKGRVENNKISNIGYEGNYGAPVIFWSGGASNQVVTRNTFFRTGRSLIDFGADSRDIKRNIDISYNDFYDYGRLNVDLGATYAGGFKQTDGTRIHHNWIHDLGVSERGHGTNAGVYWDMGSGPSTVDNNVFWNNANDIFTNVCFEGTVNPVSYYYNNVFASKVSWYAQSYKSPCKTPVDVQRNNIYRDDIMVALNSVTPNVANSLLENVDPQFTGTGNGGHKYAIKPTSPGIGKAVVIPGISEGNDIGVYQTGKSLWIPGYKAIAVEPPPIDPPDTVIVEPPPIDTVKTISKDTVITFKGVYPLPLVAIGTTTQQVTITFKDVTPIPPPVVPITIQAEAYIERNNISNISPGIGGTNPGSWVKYSVDLTGKTKMTSNYSRGNCCVGTAEIRLGSSTGTLIGTISFNTTGSWSTFTTVTSALAKQEGVKDVVILFTSSKGIANIDWFKFE